MLLKLPQTQAQHTGDPAPAGGRWRSPSDNSQPQHVSIPLLCSPSSSHKQRVRTSSIHRCLTSHWTLGSFLLLMLFLLCLHIPHSHIPDWSIFPYLQCWVRHGTPWGTDLNTVTWLSLSFPPSLRWLCLSSFGFHSNVHSALEGPDLQSNLTTLADPRSESERDMPVKYITESLGLVGYAQKISAWKLLTIFGGTGNCTVYLVGKYLIIGLYSKIFALLILRQGLTKLLLLALDLFCI